jgi:DDE superfamily endonuclease
MLVPPKAFQVLIQSFSSAFTRPSFQRFAWLVIAAILTLGTHTVSNLLRTLEAFQDGHFSSFHRLLSKRRWRLWSLSRILCLLILSLVPEDQPVELAGDDTVDGHRGQRVYGKGCHRDAVRSSHVHLVHRWGHKWVVLSVLVHFRWSAHAWALPCMVALYRPKELNEKEGRRHKTPPDLMRGLLAQMIHWFPSRKFIFSGDQEFGTQELAYFAHQHGAHLTLISRLPPDAMLYSPLEEMPAKKRNGRPRVHGYRLPAPKEIVSHTAIMDRPEFQVKWYGGGNRKVRIVSRTGCWYRSNCHRRKIKPVPIRWVFVEDLSGTHRNEYFFSTDSDMLPASIIEGYVGRWSLETTFQEMRPYLGLETTRGWTRNTVLRVAPCLFGLYSLIALLFCLLPESARADPAITWSGKKMITFSDAITQVRRWLWHEGIFKSPGFCGALEKLTPKQRRLLLYGLAPAA